jgi:hypothetical protein
MPGMNPNILRVAEATPGMVKNSVATVMAVKRLAIANFLFGFTIFALSF